MFKEKATKIWLQNILFIYSVFTVTIISQKPIRLLENITKKSVNYFATFKGPVIIIIYTNKCQKCDIKKVEEFFLIS